MICPKQFPPRMSSRRRDAKLAGTICTSLRPVIASSENVTPPKCFRFWATKSSDRVTRKFRNDIRKEIRRLPPIKRDLMKFFALTAAFLWMPNAFALDGQIQIHDPSTIVQCAGKYYTYGTGGSSLVSEDGWTWRRGTAPGR